MEEIFYEEDSPKHVLLKCFILLFILGISAGILLYYKNANVLKLKNVTVEVGTELSSNINDYLKNGSNFSNKYKLYLDNVDINTVGKYTYKIKYNKNIKTGYINVVDTTPPEYVLDEDIVISPSEEFNPNIFVLKCTDASLPCVVSLKNKSDAEKIKTAGSYNITILISDSEGNPKEEKVYLTVSEDEKVSSKVINDTNYYTNSENDDTIEHVLFVTLSNAISEDSKEYNTLFIETAAKDFNEYVTKDIYSTKIITAYNKYGYVIGLQVEVTFNDGTKKLIKDKVNE